MKLATRFAALSCAAWLTHCAADRGAVAPPRAPAAGGLAAASSNVTPVMPATAGEMRGVATAQAGMEAGQRMVSQPLGPMARPAVGAGAPAAAVGGAGAGPAGSSSSVSPQSAAGATAANSGGTTATRSSAGASCASLPAVTDYAQPGPFSDAKMFPGVGPNNNYHLYRPTASLGKDGFQHPIATWGNGIATTPDQYQQLLTLVASHGFVIIACNDTQAERDCLAAGLDWLVQQNTAQGELTGKLDIQHEVAIGYSWGGGAAIDTSDRPNIRATISLHGMPPRVATAFESMHNPLLLFTSTGDSFVTASGYVTPNYEKSRVQTFYATLEDSSAGHLYVADMNATACAASSVLGECRGAQAERAPVVAWLRYWVCGDDAAKAFFFGADCALCKSPWIMPQRKQWP